MEWLEPHQRVAGDNRRRCHSWWKPAASTKGQLSAKVAVLGAGVILTRGTPVYDLVNEVVLRSSAEQTARDTSRGSGGARSQKSEFRVRRISRSISADTGDLSSIATIAPIPRQLWKHGCDSMTFVVSGEIRPPGDQIHQSSRSHLRRNRQRSVARARRASIARRRVHGARVARVGCRYTGAQRRLRRTWRWYERIAFPARANRLREQRNHSATCRGSWSPVSIHESLNSLATRVSANAPMSRIAAPLVAMGAEVDFRKAGHDGLPIRVVGHHLRAIEWDNTHSSAQVKSAIVLAAIASGTAVSVIEPAASRDHTELNAQGAWSGFGFVCGRGHSSR